MSFLLDTNAVSEFTKLRPDPAFTSWLDKQNVESLWTSALVVGEVWFGIIPLEAGPKREGLEAWMASMIASFGPRLLPVDLPVATTWAEVTHRHKRALRTVSATDELIAATAIVHDLTVVTRNVRDFEASGCKLLSPWT